MDEVLLAWVGDGHLNLVDLEAGCLEIGYRLRGGLANDARNGRQRRAVRDLNIDDRARRLRSARRRVLADDGVLRRVVVDVGRVDVEAGVVEVGNRLGEGLADDGWDGCDGRPGEDVDRDLRADGDLLPGRGVG